ncbi:MAG: hypothetical protein FJ225_03565 [Lentisphaerae bacterium]|nr:hypothetical protein [Lentisphaerota bacterium]
MRLCVSMSALAAGALVCLAETEGPEKPWSLDAGTDNRARYEAMGPFRTAADDAESAVVNRLRMRAEARGGDAVALFVEGLDVREWTAAGPQAANTDDLDLHQAYLEVSRVADVPLRARLGRQEFNYGSKRILSAPSWSNKIRSFDAALLGLDLPGFKGDVFGGYLVKYVYGRFNPPDENERLLGAFNTFQRGKDVLVDAYAVSKRRQSAAGPDREVRERHTAGTRLNLKPLAGLTLEAEAAWQFGRDAGLDVGAYAVALWAQKAFETVLDPAVRAEFNLASGDSDPTDKRSETFEPPYQTTHGPYGIIDFLRWQNMREIALACVLHPTGKLTVQPEAHAYWLDSTSDAWYHGSGAKLWPPPPEQGDGPEGAEAAAAPRAAAGSHVGSELSLILTQKLTGNVTAEAGYSAFVPGAVANEISDRDVVHFGYVQVVLSL